MRLPFQDIYLGGMAYLEFLPIMRIKVFNLVLGLKMKSAGIMNMSICGKVEIWYASYHGISMAASRWTTQATAARYTGYVGYHLLVVNALLNMDAP